MKTVKLQIDGMSCASCAKAVEKALGGVPGVEKASVNFVSKIAAVDTKDASTTERSLIEAVKRAGYGARVPVKDRDAEEARQARLQLVKVIGTGALLFLGWLLGETKLAPPIASKSMIIVALVLAAYPIFIRAAKALLAKRLDADVLVIIAVIAASSVGAFVAAGEVAFIMLLGAQLEEYTVRRARRSLGGLMSLVPPTAHIRRDGKESDVTASELAVGDVVVVRAGERIPVDGVVQSGMASVNQAPVTGESMPVDRSEGDEVFVGTLAETGALIIEARRVGEDTTLARIAQLVEQAQQREAPIQRSLDRLAGWLVPVMLTLSALVFAFTHDVTRAITVLIVACPCALILATPTAMMAAIARAARAGVLIKGGQYLEAAARLHTIVFDKTGTLTQGQPEVTHVSRFDEHTEAEIVGMAAVAEKMSGHPVARAILRKAAALGLSTADPSQFQAHHGRGVTAERNGQKLVVGQTGLMRDEDVAMSTALQAHMDEHHGEGHTTIVVAHDGEVCGTICVSDTIRAKADVAIRDLRNLGVEKVVMLTGDNKRVAMQIAGRLGLDEVKAEVLPEQKAEHIESLKRAGREGGVAMVGDGVNDAPALAVADIGIAMGVTGTDVAHEAADIALMADDLSKIAFAVGLSRETLWIIKQGLIFALVYNVTMVTLASSGHLHMIGGAIAHQFSSVIVILNAMRLLRYK
ncbi:MAG TPA: cation-translocating P-type ATPase [Verrucomicrobiae bacterium]|nr:cation-translocating P-type ATPase [Verrucomicrobiae bacterium]